MKLVEEIIIFNALKVGFSNKNPNEINVTKLLCLAINSCEPSVVRH